jgi:hypothetical protein
MSHVTRQDISALAFVFVMGLGLGASVCRWLSENLFPYTTAFYHWIPTAILSSGVAVLLTLSALLLLRRSRDESGPLATVLVYVPLLLPALYLFQPRVATLRTGVLVAGALMLVASLALARFSRGVWKSVIVPVLVFVLPLALYLRTLAPTVGQHDTFEFQVLSYKLGIAHPTGYPLYVMLGKLFTLLPFGDVAYRVNLSSALFASLTVLVLYLTIDHMTADRSSSALAALCFAFTYSFWSQAVEAEVYALNALFVCLVSYLLLRSFRGDPKSAKNRLASQKHPQADSRPARWFRADRESTLFTLTCFVYGLSLTHHRTMLLLAPAIAAYVLLRVSRHLLRPRLLFAGFCAFLAPIIVVHLYIPLRWWQIHGQPITWREFSDLVLGTQFAAALQWDAAVRDTERLTIFLRSLTDQYSVPALLLAMLGLVSPLWSRRTRRDKVGWEESIFVIVAFGGYAAFGLSYDVPDISLFLIPAYLVVAVALGIGIASLRGAAHTLLAGCERPLVTVRTQLTRSVALTLGGLLPLALLWSNLADVDRSETYSSRDWGMYVLQQDLPVGSVILADSEKMAPLHYLQAVERIRPDTETGVFSDESTYRAEVDRRLSEGSPVLLARFVPGLEGSYHLRSIGPLVQVTTEPLLQLAADVSPLDVSFGQSVRLRGCRLDADELGRADTLRLTLYWEPSDTVRRNYDVRLRVLAPSGHVWIETKGTPPVNGQYPTGVWRSGEIISDFHELNLSGLLPPGEYSVQVGLFVPLSDDTLQPQGGVDGYLTVAEITVASSPTWSPSPEHPLRTVFNEDILLLGYDFPTTAAPGRRIPITLYWQRIGHAASDYDVLLELTEPDGTSVWEAEQPLLFGEHPASSWTREESLLQTLTVVVPETTSPLLQLRVALRNTVAGDLLRVIRGWLASERSDILLATLTIQPSPVSPPDAEHLPANFEDKMRLIDYEIHNVQVRKGDALQLSLTWEALASMDEDYTVFVHILDDGDRIWGQEDIQPARGTHPTTQWAEMELVADPHTVWTDPQAPLGLYRLEVGVYLLRTMERLYLLDDSGGPIAESLILDLIEIVP